MSYSKPHKVSLEMADVFEHHTMLFAGESYLSQTGWDMLSEMLGEVEPLMRATVVHDLMRELYNRNISYDKEIFQNPELIKGYTD